MLKAIISKMSSTISSGKKSKGEKGLHSLIIPAVSAGWILIEQHSSNINVSAMEMNIILLIAFLINLLISILKKKNSMKILWLIGVLSVSFEAFLYNYFKNSIPSPLTQPLVFFNSFCGIWTILTLPVCIYLIVVVIRVSRWNQQQWEEIKGYLGEVRRLKAQIKKQEIEEKEQKQKQDWEDSVNRKKIINDHQENLASYRRNADKEKLLKEIELQKKIDTYEADARIEEKKAELEHQKELNAIRRQSELDEENGKNKSKIKNENTGESKNKGELDRKKKKHVIHVAAIAVVIIYLSLYFLMPLGWIEVKMDGWLRKTDQMVESLESKNENVSVTEAGEIERGEKEEYISTENENSEIGEKTSTLVEYTIFYVALTGSFVLAAVLLWKVAEGALEYFLNDTLKHKGFSDFLTEYSTPFTILLITVCALSTFTSQGISEEGLIKFFEALAGTVLLLLLLLIAVDAVRLVLLQCVQKNSLLRISMHLVFILFVENVMGIVFGVLMGVSLKEFISSIFAFFMKDEDSKIHGKIEETLKNALESEIGTVQSGIKNRKKSVFDSFHSTNWSRRKK
ncbi:MAG: hypothetical protein OSJ60_07070 [Lachnospiraceae bacterium]|nr:hypothetical protein [Lachnospiraceae bacterium]